MGNHTPKTLTRTGNKITAYGRGTVAICPSPKDGGVMEFAANAERIVLAWNALDDLIAACKAFLVDMDPPSDNNGYDVCLYCDRSLENDLCVRKD